MTEQKYVHLHLALEPEVATKFLALVDDWKIKRPWALARLVEPEYKKLLRRQAQESAPEGTPAKAIVYPEHAE